MMEAASVSDTLKSLTPQTFIMDSGKTGKKYLAISESVDIRNTSPNFC
jgi:hypothetical protein